MITARAARLAVAGIALGTLGAVGLGRILESQLYDTPSADPLRLAAAALVLAGVAIGAAYVPARRAARLDPVAALRHD